jgi:hypothetical protein
MSFMSKDAAAWWAEWHSSAVLFPFPTWAQFEAEFCLQFIEENEQDQALAKLESHLYFQGFRDIYRYTDDCEELAMTAGYSDTLIRVTKYHSGLDPWINVTITMSGTVPDLTDYSGWHVHTFPQYKVFGRAQTGNLPAQTGNLLVQLPAALPWLHAAGVFPAPAPTRAPVSFAPLPAPVLPSVILMDVGWTRMCAFPCTCFQCGAAGHLVCECPVTFDIWHMDVLDKVIRQLGDDLRDELFTRLSTTASLLAELIDRDMDPTGFPSPAE